MRHPAPKDVRNCVNGFSLYREKKLLSFTVAAAHGATVRTLSPRGIWSIPSGSPERKCCTYLPTSGLIGLKRAIPPQKVSDSSQGDLRKSLKRVWALFVAAAVLLGAAAVYRHGHHAELASAVNPIAPEFDVSTIDGKKVALADYRGKVVLLDFWATWCTPCREEIPRFVQLQEKYGQEGFQIIGISMDDTIEPVREFYRQFHMNYPVALGGARLGELYGGILGLPIAFLIGRDGRILSKHIGPTPANVFDHEIATALGQ